MSESLTIDQDVGGSLNRVSRRDRPPRAAPEAPPVTIEDAGYSISPEDALEQATNQLAEKDRQVAAERRLAREAQDRADAAQRAANQMATARTQDQQTVVAQALEAAKESQQSSRLALRAAREAGDIDAEMSATEALSAASFRAAQAEAELARIKAAPAPVPPVQTGTTDGPTPAAQRWMDEHPRYHTDAVYAGAAIGAHNDAIRRGMAAGSEAYIDHIERTMTSIYGEGHGVAETGAPPVRPANGGNRDMTPPASRGNGAVPPSRSGGGSNGGWQTIKSDLGELLVQKRSDGTMGVRFGNSTSEANFKEGAETCRMSLADYVKEQVDIHDEIAAGGNAGLVYGDGRSFRP